MRIDFYRGVFKWGASLAAIITLTLPAVAQGRDDHVFEVVQPQLRASLVQSNEFTPSQSIPFNRRTTTVKLYVLDKYPREFARHILHWSN